MKLFLIGTGLAAAVTSPMSAAMSAAFAQHRGAPEGAVATTADEALVATIPLGFQNGWFTIEGKSSRGPLRLVFDTGANQHGLTHAVARHLDLPRVGWTRLHGGSGSESAWLVRGPDIHFGNASARRGHRIIVDDDFVTDAAGVRYDGVIGTHLFERYDIRIDGPGREIRLYEPGRAVAGEDLGPPIPMDDLGRSLVHFTVRVNGREMEAILDTGAPYTVLNTAAALLAGVELTGAPFSLLPRGIGSATIGAAPVRLTSLDLGTTRFASPKSTPPNARWGADRGGLRDPDLSGARVGLGLRGARPDRATSRPTRLSVSPNARYSSSGRRSWRLARS
ncbi:aspartyl protease family protein [Candidatus Palauibacter sp.]|uniref:aspartyl protease family protein n=1 Tax=Candidatus Palauibacter sp. TaxID=3101350 RepID=UPI003CC69690